MNPAAPRVVSRRYGQEKPPWRDAASIEANVEAEFIRPVLFGESILPYRIFRPFEGVLPVTPAGEVLNSVTAANRGLTGLHAWMRRAEAVWDQYRTSSELWRNNLIIMENSHRSSYSAPRVVYAKAGTLPAACLVRDDAIIDHMLYRAAPRSESEGYY